MTIDELGIGDSEVVAYVGAGGKSTLMLRSASELGARSNRVVMTTTTKMHIDQIPSDAEIITPDSLGVVPAGARTFLVGEIQGEKIIGVAPEVVDRMYRDGRASHILIEADGARRRSFKAPAEHEPVVPTSTTLLVVIAGVGVVGGAIADVAHRPDRVAALLDKNPIDPVRPEDVALVMSHPAGGLKALPEGARAIAVLTGVRPDDDIADEIAHALRDGERFDRIVLVGPFVPDRRLR